MSDLESIQDIESGNEDLQSDNENLEIIQEPVEEAEEVHEGDENGEKQENNDQSGDESKKVAKSKKVVRKPQPKLNADTLRGPKGLIALEGIFKKVKFMGPGHEEQDLNLLMKTYEYWCNRLFPKYPFDDCIARIEKLGSKKIVQTYVKKMRLGMLFEDQPITDDVEEEQAAREDNMDDPFDDLLDHQTPPVQQQSQTYPPSQQVILEPIELTEEQREIIRLNQEKARKLREERLKKAQMQNSAITSSQSTNCEYAENPSQVLAEVETASVNNRHLTASQSMNILSTPEANTQDFGGGDGVCESTEEISGNKELIEEMDFETFRDQKENDANVPGNDLIKQNTLITETAQGNGVMDVNYSEVTDEVEAERNSNQNKDEENVMVDCSRNEQENMETEVHLASAVLKTNNCETVNFESKTSIILDKNLQELASNQAERNISEDVINTELDIEVQKELREEKSDTTASERNDLNERHLREKNGSSSEKLDSNKLVCKKGAGDKENDNKENEVPPIDSQKAQNLRVEEDVDVIAEFFDDDFEMDTVLLTTEKEVKV